MMAGIRAGSRFFPCQIFFRSHRLGHQHVQAVAGFGSRLPAIGQEPGFFRVVDNVHGSSEPAGEFRRYRTGLHLGIHAHRGGIDDHLASLTALQGFLIGLQPGVRPLGQEMSQGLTGFLPFPDQDPDGGRFPVRQYLEDRLGGPSVPQHRHIPAFQPDAGGL